MPNSRMRGIERAKQKFGLIEPNRAVVCVQGLGFVGCAMATAIANALDNNGEPYFHVIGLDLDNPQGRARVNAFAEGRIPINSTDKDLEKAFVAALGRKNLVATTDPTAYSFATITVVDIHLDVITGSDGKPDVSLEGILKAVQTVASRMPKGSLILIETTVPPGTCANVIAPEIARVMRQRGLQENDLLLAYSYERVMPGEDYFNSIVNFWRVYSGHTSKAADACEEFLKKLINVQSFPLTRLPSTTACETAKVLENSYRATNIAFMEEWGRFAENAGIDIFEVVNAIRLRPTHSNMRQPGFGVGGYCLTKDPLLAEIGAKRILGLQQLTFPFSRLAVEINKEMPLASLNMLTDHFIGKLSGKKVLLLGVSYREDVGDTRFSPSEVFFRAALSQGLKIDAHDPWVSYWPELDLNLPQRLPEARDYDALVFAVPHKFYRSLCIRQWLDGTKPFVLDANNVLNLSQWTELHLASVPVRSIGRGVHG